MTKQNPNIVMMALEEIKPYEKNPRRNEHAVDGVAKSIKEFGFKVPIVVDKDKIIVTGHTRYKASQKLGLSKVPVIIADDLSKEQIKAYRLADNKVSEKSIWDTDLLREELMGISNIDMGEFDFYIPEELDLDLEDLKDDVTNEKKEYNEKSQSGREYNNEIIQYNIIFDNAIQKDIFCEFLVRLKKKYPNEQTQAGRIIKFLKESDY